MSTRIGLSRLLLASLALTTLPLTACSSSTPEATPGTGGAPSTGSASGGGGVGGDDLISSGTITACQGLACNQVDCGAGATTKVSGVVYDPAGKVPLYNVVVYVPNAPLDPVPEGASCDQCGAMLSGAPLVSAITDTQGRFVLEDVPAGADIPLVLQVGKWRRSLVLPKVTACQDNTLDDPGLFHLPRNQAEGNLPKIALTTGGADPLECLLRKIGIDDAEFTPEGGPGRINLFAGHDGATRYADALNGGAPFAPATSLWGDVEALKKYDIVLMACEGEQDKQAKPESARKAMFEYTASGGRVFASHWHNYWLEAGPAPFPDTAVFNHQPDLSNPFTARIDTGFPKGAALADWLVHVGASATPGELSIHEGQHTIDAVNPMYSQRWIYGESPQSVQYLTFNTPLGQPPEKQCGRMVLSDIHVSSGDAIGKNFPNGCTTADLSPQEKALLFMLFDLSACVQPDDVAPSVPK